MAGWVSRPVVSPPPATWAVDTGPLTCRRSTQCRAGRCRPARGSRAPPSPGTAGRRGHRGAGLAPRPEPGRGWASRTQLPLPSTLSPGCHCQGAWAGGEEAGDGQTGGHQQAPGDETREGWERHPHLPRFPGTGHLRQAGQHVTLSAAGLGARATCWATLAPGLLAPGLEAGRWPQLSWAGSKRGRGWNAPCWSREKARKTSCHPTGQEKRPQRQGAPGRKGGPQGLPKQTGAARANGTENRLLRGCKGVPQEGSGRPGRAALGASEMQVRGGPSTCLHLWGAGGSPAAPLVTRRRLSRACGPGTAALSCSPR